MTFPQHELSQGAAQEDLQTNSTNKDNRLPPVPLSSRDLAYSKEEYWLPSYIEDQLYLEMCEKEIEYPSKYAEKMSKYYLQAAKYAGRISAGNFSQSCHGGDSNTASEPIFSLELKDFSPRLTTELAELYNTDKNLLDRVVTEAVFRIFKARHTMIFYQYIQCSEFRWRFD
jgi:hypothetical protein